MNSTRATTNVRKPDTVNGRRKDRSKGVSAQLDRRLVGYALTATAAGVSTLALASPARADIIYTPADTSILPGRTLPNLVPLDLNNDGVVDFTFSNLRSYSGAGAFLGVYGAQGGNKIMQGRGILLAAALSAGAQIGPGGQFVAAGGMAFASYKTFPPAYGGSWINITDRYLGLEFTIAGQEYFGWARLDVSQAGGFNATLTGYAYDTVPGQGLAAGQTSATPEPGTLELLALGSLGLGFWRRRKTVGSQQ